MKRDAPAIYRSLLDALATRLTAQDVIGAMRCLAVPFAVHTLDRTQIFSTRAALAHALETCLGAALRHGATDLRCRMEDARFQVDGRIEGFHVTELAGGDAPLLAPFATRLVLIPRGPDWLAAEAEATIGAADWPVAPGPAAPTTDRTEMT